MSPAEHFELLRALARMRAAQVPKVQSSPKILHTPVRDELLENSALRATSLLNSLLTTLAAREAVVEKSGSSDVI